MKSILYAVSFALVFFYSTFANAGNVEFLPNGAIELLPSPVTDEVKQYGNAWEYTVMHPGMVFSVVVINRHEKMAGFFHEEVTPITKVGFTFDKKERDISIVRDKAGKSYERFNPYFMLWLLAIVAMLRVNFLISRGYSIASPTVFTAAFLAALFALGASLSVATLPLGIITAFVASMVITVSLNFFPERLKVHSSKIFYGSMITSALFVFGPYS